MHLNYSLSQVPDYYKYYIKLIEAKTLAEAYTKYTELTKKAIAELPEEKLSFSYADGKWTIAQLLIHCFDTERIFMYRALCFARGEKTKLPGYDENIFSENAPHKNRSKQDLLDEFISVRYSSLTLLKQLGEAELTRSGNCNNYDVQVWALFAMNLGHYIHHLNVMHEKYFAKSLN